MSSSVQGFKIKLTRGDTFRAQVGISNPDGTAYVLQDGDSVRFRCVKKKGDAEALIQKTLGSDLILELEPSDTNRLQFGTYFYDIQLTKADGDVDTFIPEGSITVAPESDPVVA